MREREFPYESGNTLTLLFPDENHDMAFLPVAFLFSFLRSLLPQ